MHGLVNRSIQHFICDSYGAQMWQLITVEAELGFTEFEGMLTYDKVYTPRILDAAASVLGRQRGDIMEDFGAYLVSNPGFEAVRRLLRFGGVDFADFLHSLNELPDRVRLALSDLKLPKIDVHMHDPSHFTLTCDATIVGYGHVWMGVLRVMADDYGVLAVLDHKTCRDAVEEVSIRLVEVDFAEGRRFDLGAPVQ